MPSEVAVLSLRAARFEGRRPEGPACGFFDISKGFLSVLKEFLARRWISS